MSTPHFREGYAPGPKGLRLYWRIDGERGPWLVCLGGLGVTLRFWDPFAERMRHDYRVVRWEYRGHGRSDSPRDPYDIGILESADDLEAIYAALQIPEAALLGYSLGSQVGFEFYRRHPEQVSALVPTLGFYRRGLEPLLGPSGLVAIAALKKAVDRAPALFAKAARPVLASGIAERFARWTGLVDARLAPHELMVQFMEQFMRLDLRTFLRFAESTQEYDASDVLPTIGVPVLAVTAERDSFAPAEQVREMVARIPGAELMTVPHGTHAALIEQPDLLCLRVRKFLEERVERDSNLRQQAAAKAG